MSRRPPKMGDEDDHTGCPREEDEPRGLPKRGGHWEHSQMEVEERLLDNHAWMWNETLPIIYHPRGCKVCMEYSWHVMEAELMKDDNYVISCKGRKEEVNKSQQVHRPTRRHGQKCSLVKTMSYETQTRDRERQQLQGRPPRKKGKV